MSSESRIYSLRRNRSNSPHRSPLHRRKLRECEEDQSVFENVNVSTYNDTPEHLYGLDPIAETNKTVNHQRHREKRAPSDNSKMHNRVNYTKIVTKWRSFLQQLFTRERMIGLSCVIFIGLFSYFVYKSFFYLSSLQFFLYPKEKVNSTDISIEKIEASILHNLNFDSLMNQFNSQKESIESLDTKMKSFDGKCNCEDEISKQKALIESVQQQLLITLQAVKSVTERIGTMQNTIKQQKEKEKEKTLKETNGLCKGKACKYESVNMHETIQSSLEVYNADSIGVPDFALESAGGSIHLSHHSPTCDVGTPIIKVFGLPLWDDPRSPRSVITPDALPNQCWPMKGTQGYVVIKLAAAINPTMVTLQHLDKRLDQYSKDMYTLAPKEFEVYAWLDSKGSLKVKMGLFTYLRNGSTIQSFKLKVKIQQPVLYMELRIINNYGNDDCTCIYRFRVHGSSYSWQDFENNNSKNGDET